MTSQEHSQWLSIGVSSRGDKEGWRLETKFQSLQRMLHSVDEIFLHPG